MSSELTKEDIFRMFAETDREIKEAFKETDKKIKELATLFTGQWGKLIEALVRPSALKLFQERGVKVTETYQRLESYRNGSQMEIDILLANDREAVVIEVKTTLKVEDVNEFLDNLARFTFFFPRYKGLKIYGAVAGIQIEEGADKFAYRQGLFVLTGSGDTGIVRILNNPEFRPRNFGDR
ncbi:MAG: DUF3782 domain-containing protein [Candidatus Syntrophoarchaeum sp.]|nr:DUF3782 domain-containing protein [Candidatus Syntrophoarchaeum sp.]